MIDGSQQVVSTVGTAVPLTTSSKMVARVTITALFGNTGRIYVGGKGVSGVAGMESGYPHLFPSDSMVLESVNLADVYIDATVAGEGVQWAAT